MAEDFDIKVPIKEELKKNVILGIEAMLRIEIILGFYAYSPKVMQLLQTLSHSTRAYIVNENGLPGFVVNIDIIKILKSADKQGKLKQARKWQIIDLERVEEELNEL